MFRIRDRVKILNDKTKKEYMGTVVGAGTLTKNTPQILVQLDEGFFSASDPTMFVSVLAVHPECLQKRTDSYLPIN